MQVAQTILNSLQIASPCSADWNAMSGSERIRSCAQCDKHVYDLSALSADEALMLIRDQEGRLCVRLWRRADGTVLTADCPVGRRRLRERRMQRQSAAVMAVLAAAMLNVSCARPQSLAAINRRPSSGEVTVTVGGAVASIDTTNAGQGHAMSSNEWEHLPMP